MCIVKGQLVYFGPPDKVGLYWAQLGMMMEDFTNPCDFMMRIVNDSDIRMENKEKRRKVKSQMTSKRNQSLKEMTSQKSKIRSGSYISNKQIKQSQKDIEKKDEEYRKLTDSEIMELYKERIEKFRDGYHARKKTIDFNDKGKFGSTLEQASVPEFRPGFCRQFGAQIKRAYKLYFKSNYSQAYKPKPY